MCYNAWYMSVTHLISYDVNKCSLLDFSHEKCNIPRYKSEILINWGVTCKYERKYNHNKRQNIYCFLIKTFILQYLIELLDKRSRGQQYSIKKEKLRYEVNKQM